MSSTQEIKNIINYIQPFYDELNSKYSKSYLSGSEWYVGDSLMNWWEKCNTIRYFDVHLRKLRLIVGLIIMYNENKLRSL